MRRRRAIGDSGRRLRRARALHGTTVGRTASIGHMYRALRFELGTSAFRLLPAMDDGWSGARPRVEVSRRQRVEILCAALSLILVERPHDVGQGETDIERMGSKLSATVTARIIEWILTGSVHVEAYRLGKLLAGRQGFEDGASCHLALGLLQRQRRYQANATLASA